MRRRPKPKPKTQPAAARSKTKVAERSRKPSQASPPTVQAGRKPVATTVATTATIAIGVDLVNIPRMRDVIARWDDKFLRRVFTDGEIAYCRARRDPVPHFAARFAAKEAAMKALGTGLSLGVRWRDLEVRRDRGQAPRLLLHGRSREIGLARGGRAMLLALTHDGDYALAQTMLVDEEPHVDPPPR
jgi:holo-[acyl-carrier protein] synthase